MASININLPEKLVIDKTKLQKMLFINNAIEDGWEIKMNKDNVYTFSKKHENKKEIFNDKYLMEFIKKNITMEHYNNSNN
jgi:hypothetical protein|tara:strand:- start:11 stop:250 length:240 start_codon:yes stop_codon:yes gene_type:complete